MLVWFCHAYQILPYWFLEKGRKILFFLAKTNWIPKPGYVTVQLHCYNSRLYNSRLNNSKTLQPQDFTTPRLFNPKTLQPQIFTTPDLTTPRLYNPRTFQLQDFTTPRLYNSRCYNPSFYDLRFWHKLIFKLISKCNS